MKTVSKVYDTKNEKNVHMNGTEIIGESVEGRIPEIIAEHGAAFLENLIDSQLLQHEYSSAALANSQGTSKTSDKVGVERLPTKPTEGRKLWYDTDAECIRVNWDFRPGQSVASVKKAEEQAKRYEDCKAVSIAASIAAYEGLDMVVTDEMMEKIEKSASQSARETVYGK